LNHLIGLFYVLAAISSHGETYTKFPTAKELCLRFIFYFVLAIGERRLIHVVDSEL